MISKLGFIGAGKAGTSMGKYFAENGIEISGYYSKTKSNAADSAAYTNSINFNNIKDLIDSGDTIFLTVPDDAIADVWSIVKNYDIKGKNIVHTSGAMSSKIFEKIEKKDAYGFSLHPMCPFNDRKKSWNNLKNSYFTIEGNQEKFEEFDILMQKTGNPLSPIDADSKIIYHAASVFVSNLINGVVATGKELFEKCGLTEDFIENAWKILFFNNAKNIIENGPLNALTGPIERADHNTLVNHLDKLKDRDKIMYTELSRMILELAKKKNPERDYTEVEKELYK